MSLWKRFWRRFWEPSTPGRLHLVHLTMQGWNEEAPSGDMRVWCDPHGNVLTLATPDYSLALGLPEMSDEASLQQWSRRLAKSNNAGLIEVRVADGALGASVSLIYKRLKRPSYIFTGMLFLPNLMDAQVWTVVAGECGTTGVREAVITSELMDAGKLTIQEYERSWARDPYDPNYNGVDRSVLRFVSDDDCYDERFPGHPLSKIRRVLATLPNSVRIESRTPEL